MRIAFIPSGLIGLALLALVQGCGTIEFSGEPSGAFSSPTDQDLRGAQKAEALAQYSLGLIAQDSGDSKAAVEHYRNAVRGDPDNPSLKMELAVGLLQQGEHEELDQLLDELEQTNPDLIRLHQLRVLSLRLRGLNTEALEPLGKAIRLDPGEPMHYIESAAIHLRNSEEQQATAILNDALNASTNRLIIFRALGEVHLRSAGGIIAESEESGTKPELPAAPLKQMKEAVAEFPEDPVLLNQYGDLLILHKDVVGAIDVFTRMEELRPNDQELRQKLAMSLLAIGDQDDAIQTLEEIAEQRTTNLRIWFYLAELHENNGDIDRAVYCLDQLIQRAPEDAEGYLRKAYLLLSHNRAGEAQDVLTEAVSLMPDDQRVTEMLAFVYMANAEFAAAIELFEKVEAKMLGDGQPPILSNFYVNHAIAHQMLGRQDRAVEILRQGHQDSPDIIDDYVQVVLQNRRDTERLTTALEVLDSVKDITPENSVTYTMIGLAAFNAEAFRQALTAFEKAEALAIDAGTDEELTQQFYFWLGASAERIKLYDKAEEYFMDAISIQPDYAEAHNYLAYMHAERGVKLEDALDHVGVALAVEPANPAYLDTRGWIYYQQGLYEQAMTDIKAASEQLPDDPTIADHMGDIFKALGDIDNAVIWWRRSLASDDTNDAVREKLNAHEDAEKPAETQAP